MARADKHRSAYSFRSSDFRETSRQDSGGEGGDRLCARGEWCASGAKQRRDDGTFTRAPSTCTRAFCEKDWGLTARCLDGLPTLHGRLHAAIGDHVVREIVLRVPFGPTVPLRLDVDEIMRLIVDCVMTWHERVADVAPTLTPIRTRDWRERSLGMRSGDQLPHSVKILAGHLTTLLGLPAAPMLRPSASPAAKAVYAAEIVRAAGETVLTIAAGETAGNEILRLDWLGRACLLETPAPVERIIGVPCKECERRALVRAAPPQHEGDPEFASCCRYCGDLLSPDEYAEWAALNAAYHRNNRTPAQRATAA
jgi:hypothetical protein